MSRWVGTQVVFACSWALAKKAAAHDGCGTVACAAGWGVTLMDDFDQREDIFVQASRLRDLSGVSGWEWEFITSIMWVTFGFPGAGSAAAAADRVALVIACHERGGFLSAECQYLEPRLVSGALEGRMPFPAVQLYKNPLQPLAKDARLRVQ